MARYCVLILLLLCSKAWATDYYVCDCLTGAHASCSAGSNSNAGTSSSAPKQTLAGYTWSSFAAGDRVLACQGGSMTSAAIQITNTNATRSSPLTIADYAPPSGATGTPIFRANGTDSFFNLGSYFNTTPTENIVIRNIYFDGLGTGDHGLAVLGLNSLVLDNVTFHRWGFGMEITCVSDTCDPPVAVAATSNVTIRNSTFSRNTNMGILGGADNYVIEDSTFSKNGNASALVHNIYITHMRGGVIRRNTFTNPGNADSDGTECAAGNITAHGQISGLVIENNNIINTTMASGCGGISITPGYDTSPIIAEEMRDIVIRGNRVVNGPIRIACAPRILVENNSFVFNQQPLASPFLIPSNDCTTKDAPVDTADTGAAIRNNSMLFDHSVSSSVTGFQMGGLDGIGTGVRFTGNLVRFQNTGGAGSRYCFQYASTSSYTTTERNGCYNFSAWTPSHSTLANAQSAGYDSNSLDSDPGFAATPGSGNNWSMKLGGSSPYLGAGSATHGPRRSIDGYIRPATPSIGAFDANNP